MESLHLLLAVPIKERCFLRPEKKSADSGKKPMQTELPETFILQQEITTHSIEIKKKLHTFPGCSDAGTLRQRESDSRSH